MADGITADTIAADTGRDISLLRTLLSDTGIVLSDEQQQQLLGYHDLLVSWNERMNLTTITGWREVCIKHFLDSLYLSRFTELKKGMSLLDVGTGAGFPGIPLKIAFPALDVTLLDSLQKRTIFLQAVIDELGLSPEDIPGETLSNSDSLKINAHEGTEKGAFGAGDRLDQRFPEKGYIRVVHGRAEDLARPLSAAAGKKASGEEDPATQTLALRESFDLVVSRAVANLAVLSEYCIPFVKPGGYFIAYKGGEPETEIRDAEHAITLMGGQVEKVEKFLLPAVTADMPVDTGQGNDNDLVVIQAGQDTPGRSLVFIRKVKSTPRKYPRRAGLPSKEPL